MKKFLKIVFYFFLGPIVLATAAFLYLTNFGQKSMLSNDPRRARQEEFCKAWIRKVHISDRLNSDTNIKSDRIIEITPVVDVKSKMKYPGGDRTVQFTNEMTIPSVRQGINRIKFICRKHEQNIELKQFPN